VTSMKFLAQSSALCQSWWELKDWYCYKWDASREVYIPSQEYGLNHKGKAALWNQEMATGKFPLMDLARDRSQPTVYL